MMLTLATVCTAPVFAQRDAMDTLMTRRSIFPPDVAFNISYLIPEHHAEGNTDTLKLLMVYWERHCGMSEELMRCRILFAIEEGTYSEQLYRNTDILQLLRDYEQHVPVGGGRKVQWNTSYESQYKKQYGERLNRFTHELAKELLEAKERTAEETFFLMVYNNQCVDIFRCLEQPDYTETNIGKLYAKAKPKNSSRKYLHWEGLLGIWIPNVNLALLGVHPNIGVRVGTNRNKWTTDFSTALKFVDSPNTYQVSFENEMYDTKHFAGVYVGLDLAYELLRRGKHSLSAAGGVGFDGFECLNFGDDGNDETTDTKWLATFNRNIGLAYKFHYKNKRYIGVEAKYNSVNYSNTGGTNLYGKVFTVSLLVGNSIPLN